MLATEHLCRSFGGVDAVRDVSLEVPEGEIRCLVGPNGAGKTTLFNLLAGSIPPSSGRIRIRGLDVTGFSPRQMSKVGVARKFQAPSVFDEFTVLTNLLVARNGRRSSGSLLRREPKVSPEVLALAEELGLADLLGAVAGHLSHGQRQWLEIGMVLVNDPTLLLLDEPTAGMTAEETSATESLIRRVSRSRHLTTIVIEHDIGFVRGLADRITVLHEGGVLCEGSADEVERNPEVRRVYLGGAS